MIGPIRAPYTPRCPECQHRWTTHRAIDTVRVSPLGAQPRERVRLRCEAAGCPCWGRELPPPPAIAAGRPMRPGKARRKPIEA